MISKGVSAVLLVALASSIYGGLLPIDILPSLPIDLNLGQTLNTTVINSTFIQAVTTTGYQIQYDLAHGVVLIGGGPNNIGTVALPLDTLCHASALNDYITCFVCNNDCLGVHNTFGGKCGPNPTNPSVNTCLCADSQADATSRNITSDSTKTCAVFDPVGGLEDAVLRAGLRARMLAVQCINFPNPDANNYNSTGCQVDCVDNHGYKSGVCQLTKAQVAVGNPTYDGQNNLFCECSH